MWLLTAKVTLRVLGIQSDLLQLPLKVGIWASRFYINKLFNARSSKYFKDSVERNGFKQSHDFVRLGFLAECFATILITGSALNLSGTRRKGDTIHISENERVQRVVGTNRANVQL